MLVETVIDCLLQAAKIQIIAHFYLLLLIKAGEAYAPMVMFKTITLLNALQF